MIVVGVVVASFSLRDEEPNPCNVLLAKNALRICDKLAKKGYLPVLAVQWEVGLAMKEMGSFADIDWSEIIRLRMWPYGTIEQADDGQYLGTKEVLDGAMKVFADAEKNVLNGYKVSRVVGVANPFVHQPYLYWLMRGRGIKLMWRRVGWIGFDKQSNQWWCRSWWQFLQQSVRLAIGKDHGYENRQVQS